MKICKSRKICDHIIFVGNDCVTIVIVEFKSRNARPSEIEKKLVNCSMAALNILEELDNLLKYEFYHIVIVKLAAPRIQKGREHEPFCKGEPIFYHPKDKKGFSFCVTITG